MNTKVLEEYIKVFSRFSEYMERALIHSSNDLNKKLVNDIEDYLRKYSRETLQECTLMNIILECQRELQQTKKKKADYIVQKRISTVKEIYNDISVNTQEKICLIQDNQDSIQHQINTLGDDRPMIDYKISLADKFCTKIIEEYPMISSTIPTLDAMRMIIGRLITIHTNDYVDETRVYLNTKFLPLYQEVEILLVNEIEDKNISKEIQRATKNLKYRYK